MKTNDRRDRDNQTWNDQNRDVEERFALDAESIGETRKVAVIEKFAFSDYRNIH